MEALHVLTRGAIILIMLIVAVHIAIEIIRLFGAGPSEKYRKRVESKSADFAARYEKCMVEYVRNSCHVTHQLRMDLYLIVIEVGAQAAFIGYNLFRLQPEDRASVVAYREKWYQYEQDIGRLIGVKVR